MSSPHVSATLSSAHPSAGWWRGLLRRGMVALLALTVAIAIFWERRSSNPPRAGRQHPVATNSPRPSGTLRTALASASPAISSAQPSQSATPSAQIDAEDESAIQLRALLDRWHTLTTGDTKDADRLTAAMLALLTDENTARLVRSLSADDRGTPFGRAALARWLHLDAFTATSWLAAQSNPSNTEAQLVARNFVENPAGLESLCGVLPESDWKQTLLREASLADAAAHPQDALTLAQRMQPGASQADTLQTVVYDWMGRDSAAATEWIEHVTDPALREPLLVAGAKAIAATDPDLAAHWLASLGAPDRAASDAMLSVVETWADRAPAQAAGWVARLPTPSVREAAVGLVTERWLETDPSAAIAWIRQLPEHETILARLEQQQRELERPPDDE